MVTAQTRRSSLSPGSASIATARTPPYVENTWCMALSSIDAGTPATRTFAIEGSNATRSSGHSVVRRISAAHASGAPRVFPNAPATAVARLSEAKARIAAPPPPPSTAFPKNRTERTSSPFPSSG